MADRYWVGGTAAWDGTADTKWALTSGGAGGQAVPTSADDVFFDAASTGVCTISTGNTGAKSINCTGFTGTLTGTAAITISGSVTLVAGMTYSYTGTMTLNGTGTITSAGKTFGSVIVNGAGITVTLGAALSQGFSSTRGFTLTQGTLALAGFTLTCGVFNSSGSSTRAISFGTGGITLTHNSGSITLLNMANMSNFSWTGSTGNEGFSYVRTEISGTGTFSAGSSAGGTVSNAVNLSLRGSSSGSDPIVAITTGSYVRNLVFQPGSDLGVSSAAYYACGNLEILEISLGGTVNIAPIFLASGTIRTFGQTIGSTTVNGSGITVTLLGALFLRTTSTFTLTQGTLNLANFNLSTGIFSSSGTSTRAISFGSGNIALTSTTALTTVLQMLTATGFTWTGTGGFTRNMAATATVVFGTTGGSTTNAPNLTVNAGASALTITNTSYFKEVNFTGSTSAVSGSANMAGNLTLASGGTYTSFNPTFLTSASITSNGRTLGTTTADGAGITVTLAAALNATQFTLTQGTLDLANFTLTLGVFSSSNSNTRSVLFGSANIVFLSNASGTCLSMAVATNFTWTGTGNFTRNMLTTATVVFGTTGGSITNAPNLTINAGGSSLTITSGSWFKNVNFTGSISIVTASNLNVVGDLTLASGGFYTAVAPTFLASATVTSNGKTLGNTTINGSGITVTLADALTLGSGNILTLTQGTFTAANFNVTAARFSSSNSNTRTLNMGSGTWTISGSGATAWDTATTTGLTVVPSTSTITMTNASAKTFAGGGVTYYNLNQGGAGALTISGSNTFNNITNSTQPATVTFTAGTTQTVSAFGLSGTAGNLITINSDTPGSQFTLSKSSGAVDSQYLSIQDSNATGGAVWNALYSTNLGNNTGWVFSSAGGNMFFVFG